MHGKAFFLRIMREIDTRMERSQLGYAIYSISKPGARRRDQQKAYDYLMELTKSVTWNLRLPPSMRGEQKEGTSDLDVLVEFRPGAKVSLLDFVEMENYLSDLLGIKVDLVEKSTLKPRIGKRVLGEIVYPW